MAPPDLMHERVPSYSFGSDMTESKVRIRKDDTPETIREGLKRSHPGLMPAQMLFEGGEVDESHALSEWATKTWKSDIRVTWTRENHREKFWMWTPDGEIDLGDEELDNQPAEEMFRSLKSRNQDVGKRTRYLLFVGNVQIHWTDLPKDHAILVPRGIPVATREASCSFKDLNASSKPRTVSLLVPTKWQLFTNEKEESGPLVDARVPNETTPTQLVAGFIVPEFEGRLDFNIMFYWNL
jgi:hypothetical protein